MKPAGGWSSGTETATLTASGGAAGDYFGNSVAVSGGMIVAGAPYAEVSGHFDGGAAYVFVKPAAGWASGTQTAKLTSSDGRARDHFGDSVGASGRMVVAGAPFADVSGVVNAGAAYVYWRAPASISVTKDLVPASDAGRFDLKVAGTVVKAGAGDGGSGALRRRCRHVPGGRERVGRDEPVRLLDLDCLHDQRESRPVREGDDTAGRDGGDGRPGGLHDHQQTQGASHAQQTPRSRLRPWPIRPEAEFEHEQPRPGRKVERRRRRLRHDPGRARHVDRAGEPATGTSLSDYTSSIACTRNGGSGPSGNGSSLQVTLAPADVLVCTLTNQRK